MKKIDINKFDIFPWNKNFETGVDHIDEQHKKLVEILNRLAVNLAHRSSTIILDSVFNELVEYTDYHFKSEENYWQEHLADDPWSIQHHKTHNSFIERVLQIKNQKTDKNSDQIVQEIVAFLSHWLAYHILDTDKRMAYVAKQIIQGSTITEAKDYADKQMSGMMKTLINTVLNMYDNLSVRTLDLMREKALRKQAEQALLASEERWDFIVKGSEDSIWEWNINDKKTGSALYNNTFFKFLVQKENTNKNIESDIFIKIHPEDVDRVNKSLQQHLDGDTEFFTSKYRVLLKNNSWSWVSSKGKVVERDNNGTVVRIVGTHTDITERELGSLIFKQSYQSIIITDTLYDIKNINPAFVDTTGFSETETYSQNFFFWFSEKDKKENIINIKKEIKKNGIWTGEILGQKKNGEIFTALTNILPISKVKESFNYYVIMFTDISERKEIEKKLLKAKEKAEESDQLKTEFINNMSHEIRTPMNGILGFSDLLNNENLTNEKRKSYTGIIQNSGQQLLHIIDDILEISRLGTEQVKVTENLVSLNQVMLEQFLLFNLKAKESNIPLYLKKGATDNESFILIDKIKLNKILSNLLDNALKYTNEGCIEYGYKIKNNINNPEVEIYVKDTGIGIHADYHKTIFERFSQEDPISSIKTGGLGLGLAIAKENVKLLKGDIQLTSEKGKGATFTVIIPYKTNITPPKTEDIKYKKKKECTILIAEDEEINFMLLVALLETEINLNCKIIHAKNGKEAVEISKNTYLDLILMDIKMPLLNGVEATKLIKMFKPELPIVAQTAYATETDKLETLMAGCDDYISKPIDKNKLHKIILKYLNK